MPRAMTEIELHLSRLLSDGETESLMGLLDGRGVIGVSDGVQEIAILLEEFVEVWVDLFEALKTLCVSVTDTRIHDYDLAPENTPSLTEVLRQLEARQKTAGGTVHRRVTAVFRQRATPRQMALRETPLLEYSASS